MAESVAAVRDMSKYVCNQGWSEPTTTASTSVSCTDCQVGLVIGGYDWPARSGQDKVFVLMVSWYTQTHPRALVRGKCLEMDK